MLWLPAAAAATATARLNRNRNHSTGFGGTSGFLRASLRAGERRACGTGAVGVYWPARLRPAAVGMMRAMRAPVVPEGRPAGPWPPAICLLESGNHMMLT